MIKTVLITFSALLSFNAFSWAHSDTFVTHPNKAQGYLIFDLIEKSSINYCLSIPSTSRFKTKEVEIEVEEALQVWLRAFTDLTDESTEIIKSDCNEDIFDIQIKFDKQEEDYTYYFTLLTTSSGRATSRIRIYDGPNISSLAQLKSITPNELSQHLEILNRDGKKNYRNDRINYGAKAFYSIYKTLIHEFGHGFGLCDTREETLYTHCDPEYRSNDQPFSVMKNAESYSLTPDDLQGVKTLVNRFDI